MRPNRLEFSIAKAEYLLNHTSEAGKGGDKRKFWHDIMGFRSAETIREAILREHSVELLQLKGQNPYGERYQATISITAPSGITRSIETCWIVLFDEDIARFVTAYPARPK
jgi:hypothetical protein